jgi:DNA polymerase-3 subunit alpha
VDLSDQTGQYEAILFQETLNQHRDLFEKGSAVLITVQASAEGDEVRVRVVAAEALEAAACRIGKGLQIRLRDDAPLTALAKTLDRRGDGEVSVLIPSDGGRSEVEIRLPGRFEISPAVAVSLRSLAGIASVENV